MDAGQLVPDEITVRLLLERLGRPDAAAGRHPRRLPADGGAGRGPGRGARRARRAGLRRRPRRRPGRGADPAHVRPLDLPRGGAPIPRDVQPAARPGRLRPRRLRALPARGRPPGDHPDADGPAARRPRRGHRALPRVRHPVHRRRPPGHRRGGRRHRRGAGPGRRRAGGHRGARRPAEGDHAQDAGRRSRRCGRRDGSWPRCWPSWSCELKPGVSTAELDRLAERPHPASGRHPVVPRLPRRTGSYDRARPAVAIRPRPASPSTTRSSTGSRATGRSSAGQLVSVDVGVIYDGWHGDGARTFVCGGPDGGRHRPRPSSSRPRGWRSWRDRGGAARAPHRGHLGGAVEDVAVARRASGSSASTAGTGSATSMHEDPARPQLPPRGAGHRARSRASAWPSSRCSRSACEATRDACRRLDGRAPWTGRWPPTSSTRSPSRRPVPRS